MIMPAIAPGDKPSDELASTCMEKQLVSLYGELSGHILIFRSFVSCEDSQESSSASLGNDRSAHLVARMERRFVEFRVLLFLSTKCIFKHWLVDILGAELSIFTVTTIFLSFLFVVIVNICFSSLSITSTFPQPLGSLSVLMTSIT